LCELADDAGDFIDAQLARHREFDTAAGQEEVACCCDRRRPDRLFPAAHVRMGDAAAVPYLAVDASAGGVHRIGDPSPCGDLFGAVKARRADDAVCFVGDLRAFGDDKSGRCALDVVLTHHVRGHVIFRGASARHR
jgi:hypothetical protein